jgi:hypothetical protein
LFAGISKCEMKYLLLSYQSIFVLKIYFFTFFKQVFHFARDICTYLDGVALKGQLKKIMVLKMSLVVQVLVVMLTTITTRGGGGGGRKEGNLQ